MVIRIDEDFNRIKQNEVSFAPSQQIINESSEIADTLKELNDDTLNEQSFSSIDTKTRLIETEVNSMVIIDGLIALNFLPKEVSVITRSKKRLNVSLQGEGRKEIVQIANGLKEQQQGGINKLKSLFSNRGSNNIQ
jgi:hypothetical protein